MFVANNKPKPRNGSDASVCFVSDEFKKFQGPPPSIFDSMLSKLGVRQRKGKFDLVESHSSSNNELQIKINEKRCAVHLSGDAAALALLTGASLPFRTSLFHTAPAEKKNASSAEVS